MTAPESAPQPKKYKNPGYRQIKPAKKGATPEGKRLAKIKDGVRYFEPHQDDVLRWPPVYVDMRRRPNFIAKYVNMGQADSDEALDNPKPNGSEESPTDA